MSEMVELVVEIAMTDTGQTAVATVPDPDGYTASMLLQEGGHMNEMAWVYRFKVIVPKPTRADGGTLTLEPLAAGVIGVAPFVRHGDAVQANDPSKEGGL